MSTESYEYRGEYITIHLFEVKGGRWTWAYTISAGGFVEGHDRPLSSREVVLAEAKQAAEKEVDRRLGDQK